MAGNDTLDGGDADPASLDVAFYWSSPSGVIVNLSGSTVLGVAPGTASDGFGGTDTLVNINGAFDSVFNDTLIGGSGNDWLWGGAGIDSIIGGAGSDTISYDTEGSGAVIINLATGVFQDGFGNTDIVSGVENVVGSSFNDSITGNSGNNRLVGDAGNDTIDGGGGIDTIAYDNSGAVTINLATGVFQDGFGGTDVVSNVENVVGWVNNDNLTGDTNANRIEGGAGNDTLAGGTSTDNAADTLVGGDGDDLLRQTRGADVLNGGSGFDRIVFGQTGITYGGATGVTVNLAAGTSDGDNSSAGAVATVISIETVTGTAGNDVFPGGDPLHGLDSLGNSISETFQPRGGDDTITGVSGNGLTTIVDYGSNTNVQPVTVNLGTGTASDGQGGTDTLINLDQARGGAGADMLLGGSLSRSANGAFFESFRGNAGNDTIDGSGDGTAPGTATTDRASYSNSPSAVIVNIGVAPVIVGADTVLGGIARDGFGGTDMLNHRKSGRALESDFDLHGAGDSTTNIRWACGWSTGDWSGKC